MTTSEQVSEVIVKILIGILAALVLGTIVWMTWEPVVTYFFSALLSYGVPSDPDWWKCVLLVWFIRSFVASNKVTHKKE